MDARPCGAFLLVQRCVLFFFLDVSLVSDSVFVSVCGINGTARPVAFCGISHKYAGLIADLYYIDSSIRLKQCRLKSKLELFTQSIRRLNLRGLLPQSIITGLFLCAF